MNCHVKIKAKESFSTCDAELFRFSVFCQHDGLALAFSSSLTNPRRPSRSLRLLFS